MKKQSITIAAVVLLGAVHAYAQDAGKTVTSDQNFAAVIDEGFAAMDLDKDGTVTKSEFTTYMTGYLTKQQVEFDNAFDALDQNKDGKISKEESAANSALEVNFDQIDADGDGFLTKDDIRAAFQAAQQTEISE